MPQIDAMWQAVEEGFDASRIARIIGHDHKVAKSYLQMNDFSQKATSRPS